MATVILLLYIVPLLGMVYVLLQSVRSADKAQKWGVKTWGDLLAVAFAGILPLMNIWCFGLFIGEFGIWDKIRKSLEKKIH